MGVKQHTSNQLIGQKTQKENQKLFLSKWEWKHNTEKLMGYCKIVLRRKFTVINACIKKKGRSQTTFTPKELEKEQAKPKLSRPKEITKIRAEIMN